MKGFKLKKRILLFKYSFCYLRALLLLLYIPRLTALLNRRSKHEQFLNSLSLLKHLLGLAHLVMCLRLFSWSVKYSDTLRCSQYILNQKSNEAILVMLPAKTFIPAKTNHKNQRYTNCKRFYQKLISLIFPLPYTYTSDFHWPQICNHQLNHMYAKTLFHSFPGTH